MTVLARYLAAVQGVFLATGVIGAAVAQQDYPNRPIRFVVGFGAGGTSDILARVMAQKLGESIGQQIVVENRAGAGGNIALGMVSKAAPDGYTLFLASPAYVINPSLYAKVPYRVENFAPLSLVVSTDMVLIVAPSLPARTVQEFIQMARAKPGYYNFASAGSGTSSHLASELFVSMAGLKLTHIPYKEGPAAFNDLMGSHVHMMTYSLPSAVPHIKTGRIRALAVASLTRSNALPEVPTVNESGVPGYTVTNWFGILVPAATPKAIIMRLGSALHRGLAMPDARDRFNAHGADLINSSPESFAAFIRDEHDKWDKVIKTAGIKAE